MLAAAFTTPAFYSPSTLLEALHDLRRFVTSRRGALVTVAVLAAIFASVHLFTYVPLSHLGAALPWG